MRYEDRGLAPHTVLPGVMPMLAMPKWPVVLLLALALGGACRADVVADVRAMATDVTALAAARGRIFKAEADDAAKERFADLRMPLFMGTPEGLYAQAQWCNTTAGQIYRTVLAVRAARVSGIPYADALQQMPTYAPVWPRFVGTGGGAGPVDPDDDLDVGALAPNLVTAVGDMRVHVRRMRELVEAQEKLGAVPAPIVGSTMADDPDFGPWYGGGALAKSNVVPAVAEAPGPQQWAHIDGWRVIGPFRRLPLTTTSLTMPELVPADRAGFAPDPRTLGPEFDTTEPAGGTPIIAADTSGRILPPSWTRGKRQTDPGLANGACYATTEVTSAVDQEVWLAAGVNDYARLWVNDRLVWVSPATRPDTTLFPRYVFRVALRKGVNRLLVRCDNDEGGSFFSLHVCLRGAPRTRAQVEAARAAVAAARAKLPHPTAGLRGWRGDWTGRFPGANPPMAWDVEKGTNVRWRVALPLNYCTPVLAGDRIFTQVEPDTLLCLDTATGKTLWARHTNPLEVAAPEVYTQYRALADSAFALQQSLAGALTEEEDPAIRDAALREAARLDPTVKPGAAAPAPPTPAPMDDAARRAKEQEIRDKQNQCWTLLQKHAGIGRTGWGGTWYGHTYAAPITDGTRIWVKYTTGVAACYDLDGARRWMTMIGATAKDNNACPSPVMAGGKFIMEFPARDETAKGMARLIALDAETGKQAWESPAYPNPGETGSPLVVRLTDGAERMDVVVTAGSSVVRVDDGALLVADLGTPCDTGSPIADGDVVFFNGPRGKAAMQLIMVSRDQVGGRPLWLHPTGEIAQGFVLHDGLLHCLPGGQGSGPVAVFDAATGRPVRTVPNVIPDGGRAYQPPIIAGNRLIVSDDGRIFAWKKDKAGTMAVLEAGPEARVLARNLHEGTHESPVAEGDCLYVRTHNALMCIGYTGDAGKAYEAEIIARNLLEGIFPEKPAPVAPVAPQARPADDRSWSAAVADRGLHTTWLLLGPVAPDAADALRAALLAPDLRIAREMTVTAAGETHTARDFPRERFVQGDLFFAPRIDVLGPSFDRPNSVTYWVTLLKCDAPRTVRLELDGPGLRAWAGGLPVAHGGRIALGAGVTPLVVEVRIGDIPPAPGGTKLLPSRLNPPRVWTPAVPASPLTMRVAFWPSDDPTAELAAWRNYLTKYRDILDRAATLPAGNAVGAQARRVLAQ